MRYSDNSFSTRFINTIGVELVRLTQKSRTVTIRDRVIRLQLWDTAGQERRGYAGFRTLTSSYYRGSHGIAIVYDITDRTSFANLASWLGEIEKCPLLRFASEDVFKVLIGNKLDLADRRTVSSEEAKELAQTHELPYFETSAKDACGVQEVFEYMARQILANEDEIRGGAPGRNSFMLSDVSLGESVGSKASRKRRKCCE